MGDDLIYLEPGNLVSRDGHTVDFVVASEGDGRRHTLFIVFGTGCIIRHSAPRYLERIYLHDDKW